MKTILEYQREYWLNKSMITESFKSSILQEIAKQLNTIIEINHQYNAENEYSTKDTTNTFKSIFGDRRILWDKIADEDCKQCSIDNPDDVKLAKRLMSNRANSFRGMIININSDKDSVFKYTGTLIHGVWDQLVYISLIKLDYRFTSDNIRPGMVEDYLADKFIIVDLEKYDSKDIQGERSKAKAGAFNVSNSKYFRDDAYKRMAERNFERYKQYAAKIKANKDADDGMAEKVTEYAEKIMDVTKKLSKDPMKYVKYEYDIGYLIDLLHDKKRWVEGNRYNKYKGYYSGENGLFILYKEYIQKKLSLAKGDSYSSERDSYEASKKALEKLFVKIDEKIKKFDDAA